MKKRASRPWSWLAVIILAALVIAALGKTCSFLGSDRICRGVVVSGIPAGGLSKAQAEAAISDWALKKANQHITFTALDKRWIGTPADFGARIEVREAVERAFAVGRQGGIFNRLLCVLSSYGNGKKMDVRVAVNRWVVEKTVGKIARAVNRPHRDARLRAVDGKLEVEQDSWGIKLDEEKAARTISKALLTSRLVVPLPVEADKPEIVARDADRIDTLLARFTTWFNRGKRDRSKNLLLAANAVNGVIVKPGQEFSYNNVVGPREEERGFRSAPIFVRGKMEPGVGGGVCQVSSTLYNSVLLAGLTVVERHHHSRTVPYVSPGRDATVNYGHRDFRFTNSNSFPISVLAYVKGPYLTIDVYGAAGEKKNVSIFTGKATYTPHGQETVADASLAAGARSIVDVGASGVSVIVYRKITQPDGTSVTEVLSRDRYPAQKKIVAVGSATRAAAVGPASSPVRAGVTVTTN